MYIRISFAVQSYKKCHPSWNRGNLKFVVLTATKFTCNSLLDDSSVSQGHIEILSLVLEICGSPSVINVELFVQAVLRTCMRMVGVQS